MSTPNKIIEAFSISHAAILKGTFDIGDAGAEETYGDIYGVDTGTVTVTVGTYKNTGDDVVRSVWKYIEDAEVSIRGGFIPFDLINLLTGSTISSSGTGANLRWDIPFWEKAWNNLAPKPILIKCPSKDSQGNVRDFFIVLYKVYFGDFSVEGLGYKEGLKISYNGTAVMSATNEAGATLTKEAIGRFVSMAAV